MEVEFVMILHIYAAIAIFLLFCVFETLNLSVVKWKVTISERYCTLKSHLLLVNFYFVLEQFHIKRARFSWIFTTYVLFSTKFRVICFLDTF